MGADEARFRAFGMMPLHGVALLTADLEISPVHARALIDQGADVVLLDCRTPLERETARIEGSSFIPLQELPARLEELSQAKSRPLIVYCHGGVRSLTAARYLREQGFSMAVSMTGGIDAWSLQVDSGVPRY